MSIEGIKNVIAEHEKWLNDDGGSRADLSRANLSGAESIVAFGPMPTSGRIIYAAKHDAGVIMVKAGCFWGTVAALREKVKEDYNCHVYLAVCDMLESENFKFHGE